jgi:endonuclease YncB( thermonuclease family)
MHIKISCLPMLLMVSVASAETLTGTVVAVADGDTITVLDAHNEQHRVRLAAGIGISDKELVCGLAIDRQVLGGNW